MTPEEIAHKYVHGNHDALTDNQEKIDMAKDIRDYARKEAEDFATFNVQEFLAPLLPIFKMKDEEIWDRFMEWKSKNKSV